jgi:serine/threonine protein kinase
MALEPARLSDFDLKSPLGSGATARVFEAVHRTTGRSVAIKMLSADHGEMAAELRERFAREALTLAGVRSAYINQILGFGFEQGRPFLVLEHLMGESLDTVLKREGAIAFERFAPWVGQLLLGIRECHASNVIHRDIKPANIFLQLQPDGEVIAKLIDFGVARVVQPSNPTGLTSTQHLLGSVGYMAPEQFSDARNVGPTADLYALGVVIFRSLTNKLPFVAKTFEQVIQMKTQSITPPISAEAGAVKLPSLDQFVTRATARLEDERFQSAREMLDAWQRVTLDAHRARTGGASGSPPGGSGVAASAVLFDLAKPPSVNPQSHTPSTTTATLYDTHAPPQIAEEDVEYDELDPDSLGIIQIDYIEEEEVAARNGANAAAGAPTSKWRLEPQPNSVEPHPTSRMRAAGAAPPLSRRPASSSMAASKPPPSNAPAKADASGTKTHVESVGSLEASALSSLDDAWETSDSAPPEADAHDDAPTVPGRDIRQLIEQELQISRSRRPGKH